MRYTPKVSIIIRTKNDAKRLPETLDMLGKQDYKGEKELILVDTSSTDGTPELAKTCSSHMQMGEVKIVTITQEEFSYPKSMNAGMQVATGELAIITVGHAIPFTTDWISSGVRHFANQKVAGVFAPPIARNDAQIIEKLFYIRGYLKARWRGAHIASPQEWSGILGATNCMIRKSVWDEHPFDEAYGLGGEDVAWATWAIEKEYTIICDYKFSLRHSHGNDWQGLKKQIAYWRSLSKPQPFNASAINFRKDIDIT